MTFFDTIIKRVANFSVQSFENNKQDVIRFFDDNGLFQLAVLVSSPSLYQDVIKNKSKKIEVSLSKYFVRAHFNPTPFGVFNSVGLLKWGKKTSITKSEVLKLSIKHDNLFLSSKINNNMSNEWMDLSYCLNPSIHFLNNTKIAFYKSKSQDIDKIATSYVEIDFDDDLKWLVDRFKKISKINLVLEELILKGFERSEVENYLFEIIEEGLIIDFFLFNPYAYKLSDKHKQYSSTLIENQTYQLRKKSDIVNFTEIYVKEQNAFLDGNTAERYSHMINSFDLGAGSLDSSVQEKVKKFINFAIQYNSQNTPFNDKLNRFFNEILNRFGETFIPLNTIFNPYSGLNYSDVKTDFKLKLHDEIIGKILSSTEKNLFLNLTETDCTSEKGSKLPATFNVVLEILQDKISGDKTVYVQQLGNSALSMISRFGEITHNACQDIVDYEKEVNYDKIIADINCIGNFRSVNLSPIKQLYDYCLPINTFYTEEHNPIFLSDIYVHLNRGNFFLVSKKYGKQILPKKTSAINPKVSDSDIYNFLCDLEFYNQEIYAVNFDFNSYSLLKPYIPRIYLEKGILLYPAQMLLVNNNDTVEGFKNSLKEKIKEFSFSTKINFSDSKGKLILDTENENDVLMIFEKLKIKKHFFVSECLYESFNPEITRDSECFAHELILNVKNIHYGKRSLDFDKMDIILNESKNIPVLSDWLYLELFCNSYADSEILKCVYNDIILENKTNQFFFVHYANPDRHLRLRFKTSLIENKQYIISIVHELKLRNIISNYQILPYEQEIHRYGGIEMMTLSETIFNLDSQDLLVNVINKDLGNDYIRIISILKMKNYLQFLGYSLDEMIIHCDDCIVNFSKEFKFDSNLRRDFNKEYASIKFKIEKCEYDNFLNDQLFKKKFSKQVKKSKVNMSSYTWSLIHMSMNRHFNEKQRFNEFKSYYFAKCYLNQLKFTEKKKN